MSGSPVHASTSRMIYADPEGWAQLPPDCNAFSSSALALMPSSAALSLLVLCVIILGLR